MSIAIQRMESMRSEWGGNNPLVVRLVYVLVKARMVFNTVDPINASISKDEEQRYTQDQIHPTILVDTIVSQSVASNF